MKENVGMKKFLAVFFCVLLVVGFVRNGSYLQIAKYSEYLKQDSNKLASEDALTMEQIESDFSSDLFGRRQLFDLNGSLLRGLNIKSYYSGNNIYVMDGDYIVSPSPKTSTDYELKEIKNFNSFLSKHHINLLYVNTPTKYLDDSLLTEQFGIESYCNRNADYFLARLDEAGIANIDLRKNLKQDGLDVRDLFYRTDHHWTVPTGLWASKYIAGGLNQYCGYSIDLSLYDKGNYDFTTLKNCWLGEQGKKVSAAYVGLDDYTKVTPKFDTSYTFFTDNRSVDSKFSFFIDGSYFSQKNNIYDQLSLHYSYHKYKFVNHNVEKGNILFLCDSFGQATYPFLSLGVHKGKAIILRDQDVQQFDLRSYILDNKFDTVVVCYVPTMIGAHDNPKNANHRMFTFK